MITDPIGPREISGPYHHSVTPHEEEAINDKALLPDAPSIPKEGVNPLSKTETAATLSALLRASKETR